MSSGASYTVQYEQDQTAQSNVIDRCCTSLESYHSYISDSVWILQYMIPLQPEVMEILSDDIYYLSRLVVLWSVCFSSIELGVAST